jgi:hypothetical protein
MEEYLHDLNLWISFIFEFAIIGGSPDSNMYKITPTLQISDFEVV